MLVLESEQEMSRKGGHGEDILNEIVAFKEYKDAKDKDDYDDLSAEEGMDDEERVRKVKLKKHIQKTRADHTNKSVERLNRTFEGFDLFEVKVSLRKGSYFGCEIDEDKGTVEIITRHDLDVLVYPFFEKNTVIFNSRLLETTKHGEYAHNERFETAVSTTLRYNDYSKLYWETKNYIKFVQLGDEEGEKLLNELERDQAKSDSKKSRKRVQK
eukprot:TRINITY_DN3194_c0_g1_i1.p1 TRINITY_DN3194_c0_g1~~TRINITY_DN3194_c0_g1_i1.p1  ORF type:complete len:213 (+),score=48.44 TRINITY_DN3194_c0_g1_i1:49-687(+)